MDEQTKQFVIKMLVAGAVVLGLYFITSPYQNCVRQEMAWWGTNEDGSTRPISLQEENRIHTSCRDETTW